MSNYKVGFIGGGNMAKALAGGLTSSGYPSANLSIAEPNSKQRAILQRDLPGVTITGEQ